MIPLADARALVLDACPPLAARSLPVGAVRGCVTVAPVRSAVAVPGFDNSAVDGFAVRAADLAGAGAPAELVVDGTVQAGQVWEGTVGPGHAVRIMTGAPVPPGADAVVMVEQSRPAGPERVLLEATPAAGAHVRRAGEDVAVGDEVVPAGTLLSAAHLGVLATVGRAEVEVVPRPRVGVLSTGDELVAPGRPLGPGQIHDSNRPMLLALVAEAGCEAVDLGHQPDDEATVAAALARGAASCDVVLSSGGVSMGDADVVKLVLQQVAGARWLQVAIRPAKPFALGVVDGTPVLGLPGNPVSSLVSFSLLALPGLRRRAGRSDLDRPVATAVAGAALARRPDGKVHYVRVATSFDGAVLTAVPIARQGSHQLSASARATALAVLPDGPGVAAGDPVELLLLEPSAALAR